MYNSNWFYSLKKPYFDPPGEIFTPVWIILYSLIFSAFVLYYLKKTEINKKEGYLYFFVQLILNFIWSPAFFILQDIGLALFIIILLDIFVFLAIKNFYKVSKISAILMVPYFIWILFATYLNVSYFVLNINKQ